MIKVMPLTKFDIDWTTLLTALSKGLGRNPTASLDRKGKKIGSISSFIEILGAMKDVQDLANPGPILRHINFSFLVISNYKFYNEDLYLSVYSVEANNGLYLAIISGTLDQWQLAVINGCSQVSDYRSRELMTEILKEFDKLGLSSLWSEYHRRPVQDNTIKLIEKQ